MKVNVFIFVLLFFEILYIQLCNTFSSNYGGSGYLEDVDGLTEYNDHIQRHGQEIMESFLRSGMEGHLYHVPRLIPLYNSHLHAGYRRSIHVSYHLDLRRPFSNPSSSFGIHTAPFQSYFHRRPPSHIINDIFNSKTLYLLVNILLIIIFNVYLATYFDNYNHSYFDNGHHNYYERYTIRQYFDIFCYNFLHLYITFRGF